MNWIKACAVEELPIGEAVAVAAAPSPIALYHIEGGFYATQNTCTHAVATLSDGYLEDGLIECPLHAARFCVKTGAAKSYPATQKLAVYPVRVEDGAVYIGLEATVAA